MTVITFFRVHWPGFDDDSDCDAVRRPPTAAPVRRCCAVNGAAGSIRLDRTDGLAGRPPGCTADEFQTRVDPGAVPQNAVVRQASQPTSGHQTRSRPDVDNFLAHVIGAVRVVGVVYHQERSRAPARVRARRLALLRRTRRSSCVLARGRPVLTRCDWAGRTR
jgi:hypothetical protein